MKKIIPIIVMFGLLTLACSISRVSPSPTPLTSEPIQVPTESSSIPTIQPSQPQSQTGGTVIFADDFSDTNSGWDRAESAEGDSTDYFEGQYRIYIKTTQSDFWANPNDLVVTTDVVVEVDAQRTTGPETTSYGIVCGYVDPNNFHALTIGSDGFVEIYQYYDGEYSQITAVDFSPVINKEGVNHLKGSCIGQTLSLSVNGNQVASGTSPNLVIGNIGLVAGAFETADAEFLFDNLVVKIP